MRLALPSGFGLQKVAVEDASGLLMKFSVGRRSHFHTHPNAEHRLALILR
jgi:hypothetical protein